MLKSHKDIKCPSEMREANETKELDVLWLFAGGFDLICGPDH